MNYRPWMVASFTGGLAYTVGYVLVAVLLTLEPGRDLFNPPAGGIGPLDQTGALFYSSHLIGFSQGFAFFGESTDFLFETSLTIPVVVYLAVPVVVLTLAGFLVVNLQDSGQMSLPEAATSGTAVAIGYGALSLIGVFVFSFHQMFPNSGPILHPNVGETIIFMCLVYPLTFGGLGGMMASRATN